MPRARSAHARHAGPSASRAGAIAQPGLEVGFVEALALTPCVGLALSDAQRVAVPLLVDAQVEHAPANEVAAHQVGEVRGRAGHLVGAFGYLNGVVDDRRPAALVGSVRPLMR